MKVVKRVYFWAVTVHCNRVAFVVYPDKSASGETEIHLLTIELAKYLGYYYNNSEDIIKQMAKEDRSILSKLASIITEKLGHDKWEYDIVETDINMDTDSEIIEYEETIKIK